MNIIQRKVEEQLQKYGDYYFEDFDEEKITKALFAGDVTVTNLRLRKAAFETPDMPVKVIEGRINEITAMIPWSNILSEAVTIKISGLHVKVQTKNIDEIRLSRDEEIKAIIKEMVTIAKQEYLNQMNQKGSVMDFWMIKNLIDRVIDNLQITIKDLRIEVEHMAGSQPFSTEIILKGLELHTTDSSFMNKQFVKNATMNEQTKKRQIFKILNISNFLINIKPVESPVIKKSSQAYEDKLVYNIFKISVQVRLIKNSEHGENDPDYEASVKFNNNEMNLTQWQIQRILNLVDYMSKLSRRFEALKQNFSGRPERRIAEIFHIKKTSHDTEEQRLIYEVTRRNIIMQWWRYAILETVKACNKTKNKSVSGKFYSLIASMNIDKVLDYNVPGVMMEVYEPEYYFYLERIAQHNFDLSKFQEDETRLTQLRSLVFIIPLRVQRVMAKKFAREYAAKQIQRSRNSWMNYFLSYVPYFGEPGLSSDEKEFKDMLKGEFRGEKHKFSKYILKLSLDIKKGEYTLYGDPQGDTTATFGFYLNDFSVDLKLFDKKMEATADLHGFKAVFRKLVANAKLDFNIIQSTTEKGQSFLNMKFLSEKDKTKSTTEVDVYMQHVDMIYVNQVVLDLINFFKVQEYDFEMGSELAEDIGKATQESSANAKRALNNNSADISISVNVLSPRVLVPLTREVDKLSKETDLFVLYLGDIQFNHNLRSGALASLGMVYNVKLNHFKLEYWEDYEMALEYLKISDVDELADVERVNQNIKNFVITDIVAAIKYTGSNDGKAHNLNILVEYIDFMINPYVFHQLMELQPLFNLTGAIKKTPFKVEKQKAKIQATAFLQKRTPYRSSDSAKYEYRGVIFTKTHLYIFKEDQPEEPDEEYILSGFNMYLVEDRKTRSHILKLWKGNNKLSIVLTDLKEACLWINKIDEVVTGVHIKNIKERESQELPFVINIDMIIKKIRVWLYNEIFEPNSVLSIRYLDIKMAQDNMLKLKVSMDSLLFENFEKSFASRGLKTILWIGATQKPTRVEKNRNKTEEVITRNTQTVSSEISMIPGNNTRGPQDTSISFQSSVLSHSMNVEGIANKNQDRHSKGLVSKFKSGFNESREHLDKDTSLSDAVQDNIANWSKNGKVRDGGSKLAVSNEGSKLQIREFDDENNRKNKEEMEKMRRIDEAMIVYIEKTKDLTDIDVHIVNITAFYDTDYINNLIRKSADYIKTATKNSEYRGQEETGPEKTKRKHLVNQDKLLMRLSLKLDRICIILRSKNMNLFDVILIDLKVIMTQFIKRMLLNVYAKRLATRDLTGYPFTLKPDQLKSYSKQKKNLIVSFIESSKDTNIENLDNNGMIIVVEVINQDYLPENRVSTKAEIILNNGEANFFLQPVLRLVDLILVQILGCLMPDESKKLTLEEVIKISKDIVKMNFNVFLRNTRVNLLPNFYVDKCLILEVPMILVMNEQYLDPSRNISKQKDHPVYSENMMIQVKGPYMRSIRRGLETFTIKEITVGMDRILFQYHLERILGKDRGKYYMTQLRKK